jgi:N-acetylglucosamine-6-sulfatase
VSTSRMYKASGDKTIQDYEMRGDGRVGAFLTESGDDRLWVRRVLLGFLVCSVTLLALGCSGSEPAQEAEEASTQPNIIFVLTDDLDYASAQRMPNLRSLLIDQGMSFENAFVSHPVCCPSRSTILTGLYDHNHDVRSNNPPDGGFQKFLSEGHEENTIAVNLQEGGYQTAFFGKYLNGYPAGDPTHVPPGWDEWYGKEEGQKLYDYDINENGEVVSYGSETEDFYTDVLSGQATDFVRRAAAPEGRPFFMYVAPTAPHGPATPAERYQDAPVEEEAPHPPSFNEEDVSDKPSWRRDTEPLSEEEISEIDTYHQKRLRSMLAVDEMVASLVEELEAAGELDNTYVVFTSDNGWFAGQHRIKEGKDRPYEESARVPLFVRGPGVPVSATVSKLVLNTDFAPTFAELAGSGFSADGRSLISLLRGEDPPWRSAVLLEGFVGKGDRVYGAIRTDTHKYVEYGDGEEDLYDLETDPYELDNVYETADPSLVEDLKRRLDALRSCTGDRCREAEDAP